MNKNRNIFLWLLLLITGASLLCKVIVDAFVLGIENLLHHKIDFQFWSIGLVHAGVVLEIASISFFITILFKNSELKWICMAWAFIVTHFIFLFGDAVNIPITDDYKLILNFGLKYFSSNTFESKFQLLNENVGEYKLIFLRIIVLVEHFFIGAINLKFLILFGNLFLIIIVALFSKSVDEKLKPAVLLIAVLFIFHLGFYDAVGWATSMNYLWVAAFSMLSFYFSNQSTKTGLTFSILFSIVAVATFGNGILVIPVNLLIYFLNKHYKYLMLSLLFYVLLASAYFDFFQNTSVAQSTSISVTTFQFFICSLGSSFQFFYNINLATTFGAFILILFLKATVLKFYRTNLFVYATWLWIILSFVAVAFYRSPFGMATAISNRYGFFSSIAVICSCIFILQQPYFFRNKISPALFIAFAITFQLASALFFYPEMKIRKFKLQKFANDISEGKPFVAQPPVFPDNAEKIIKDAIVQKVYVLPKE